MAELVDELRMLEEEDAQPDEETGLVIKMGPSPSALPNVPMQTTPTTTVLGYEDGVDVERETTANPPKLPSADDQSAAAQGAYAHPLIILEAVGFAAFYPVPSCCARTSRSRLPLSLSFRPCIFLPPRSKCVLPPHNVRAMAATIFSPEKSGDMRRL